MRVDPGDDLWAGVGEDRAVRGLKQWGTGVAGHGDGQGTSTASPRYGSDGERRGATRGHTDHDVGLAHPQAVDLATAIGAVILSSSALRVARPVRPQSGR